MEYKSLKRNGVQALILVFVLAIASCANPKNKEEAKVKEIIKQESELSWISFKWIGDSIGHRYFDKLGIAIPFSIDGVPHQFQSQFDLGAINTMVYGNSIQPYLEEYQGLAAKLDTVDKKYNIQGKKMGSFKNMDFKLDNVSFQNRELLHFDGFGDVLTKDSIPTKSIKKMGTIGPDLFQEKYLLIDFPNQRLSVLDSLNGHYKEKTYFVEAKLDQGRIKVPVSVNDSIQYFMFDTGSSMFPLVTTKDKITLISNATNANDTIMVSTWGQYYNVHGYTITSAIAIDDLKIESNNLNIYDCRDEYKGFFEKEGIMGIMGNTFFLDKEIIIDYKNSRFGVVKE